MDASKLLILGAVGVGAYYLLKNQQAAALPTTAGQLPLTNTPATNMPMLPGPTPSGNTPVAPTPSPTAGITNAGPTLASHAPEVFTPALVSSATPVQAVPLYPTPGPNTSNPVTGGANPPSVMVPPMVDTTTPQIYKPTLDWTTSQGQNNNVLAGTQFVVNITGAMPNAGVTMSLTKDGMSTAGQVGWTSSAGSFTYSGTVDNSAFQWSFNFYVNGVFVDTFSLFVRNSSTAPTTSTGLPAPTVTTQPGMVPVASAPPATITVNPYPAISSDPATANPYSYPALVPTSPIVGGYVYQTAPAVIPAGAVTPWNI